MTAIVKYLVWLRGVIAAFSILGFVPQFFPLDQLDILKTVHATITNWNHLAELVGELFGKIPYVPELSAYQVNTIILVTTVHIPGLYSIWPRRQYANERSGTIALVLLSSLILTFILKEFSPLDDRNAIVIAGVCTGLVLIFFLLPVYRNGMLTVVVTLTTLEAVYWLNVPQVRDAIDVFLCETEQESGGNCHGISD
ncbi:MAG: hypothetical protein AAFY35_04205 [Pseudomonadota bacterium]